MTTLDRLDRWKGDGIISEEQHSLLSALVRQDRFSLFVELNALLYIGVLSIAGGLTWTFRDYVTNLGDATILAIITLLLTVTLYYCFSRALPYRNDEVESPSMVFDYVLYFGCLVFVGLMTFVEARFALFRNDWSMHLLIAAFVFGVFAYRFDNRLVLSLALSTLAGYLGLQLDASSMFNAGAGTDVLRFTGIAFGAVTSGTGVWLHRQGVKPHFLDTYLHIGGNIVLLSTLAGVFLPFGYSWLYLAMLLSLCSAAVMLGIRFSRFAFVAYGTIYGYAGISAKLLPLMDDAIAASFYFVVTGTTVLIALVVVARRFARDE